jgi:hypothetical protein
MTIKTTVQKEDGSPIPNAYVSANIQNTGATFTRFTDGNGYADVALLAEYPDGSQLTLLVQADGYKMSSQYLTLDAPKQVAVAVKTAEQTRVKATDDDVEVVVTLSPFERSGRSPRRSCGRSRRRRLAATTMCCRGCRRRRATTCAATGGRCRAPGCRRCRAGRAVAAASSPSGC